MEAYLKKYFWTVPVIVVIVCAVFAAKAANHYIEGKYLGDAEKPRKVALSPQAQKKKEKKSKVSGPMAERNMFCSECLPAPEEEQPIADSDSPPMTSLPLRLVATNVSTIEAESFATILNTSNDRQGAYNQGGSIPDAGEILRITAKYVDFKNEKSRRTERLALLTDKPPPRVASAEPSAKREPKKPSNPREELLAMIDEGVNKVDDTNFELDRKVVDKVLENPAAVARGARIVPSIKNGKANGFKLYAIRPSSVYAKIGLMNGDTIHSINGFELTSPDKALEVYMKLREANSLSVNATRRGKPVTLNYSIK